MRQARRRQTPSHPSEPSELFPSQSTLSITRRREQAGCVSSKTSSETAEAIAAPEPAATFCRANSLRISTKNVADDAVDAVDQRESSHYLLSPCTSPSFSFDTVGDFFAAMNSPVLRSPLPITEASSSTTRLRVLSPTTKRQRKNTRGSSGASTVSSGASSASAPTSRNSTRRYTSILSRCILRQLTGSKDPIRCSPRDPLARRATEATVSVRSVSDAPSCSQLLLALSSPSPTARRTVLLNEDSSDLRLLRDEAEYSDYLNAAVTGAHSEMDSVVFYELEVHLSQLHWKLYRRFSEFRALRQDLIKHFARRLRLQQHQSSAAAKCEICADILDAIEQTAFPSRQQTHRHWHRLFSGSSAEPVTRATTTHSRGGAVSSAAAVVADRKAKFAAFVAVCLRTMRGLRQHGNVMEDSSACEIGTALRLIEEFFGLSFTRYLRFLSERGVVGSSHDESKKQRAGAAAAASRRRLTTAI
ncbi:hypothetical protein PybrP1_005118 [[Pythium] brassicae (nom. inval.)]|nr:hypothetical protein PybrP1_005118 [[Pythium] brassicae (nom. inval.)]